MAPIGLNSDNLLIAPGTVAEDNHVYFSTLHENGRPEVTAVCWKRLRAARSVPSRPGSIGSSASPTNSVQPFPGDEPPTGAGLLPEIEHMRRGVRSNRASILPRMSRHNPARRAPRRSCPIATGAGCVNCLQLGCAARHGNQVGWLRRDTSAESVGIPAGTSSVPGRRREAANRRHEAEAVGCIPYRRNRRLRVADLGCGGVSAL